MCHCYMYDDCTCKYAVIIFLASATYMRKKGRGGVRLITTEHITATSP